MTSTGTTSDHPLTRPETLWEAMGFDRRTAAYLRAGLCPRDAARASYGHAHGFAADRRPPCQQCIPVVGTFPEPTADPNWRQWPRGRVPKGLSAPLTTSTASPWVQTTTHLMDLGDEVTERVLLFPARSVWRDPNHNDNERTG